MRSPRIGFTGRQALRRLFIIGIGAGSRDHVTVQAINALNAVDVFFIIDKGDEKAELNRIRQEICETYIKDRTYRMVAAPDPERDRMASSYRSAVRDWHERRVEIFEEMIARELKDGECGGFLVWGDPALYDSTLRIVQQIVARGAVAFTYEVIPGDQQHPGARRRAQDFADPDRRAASHRHRPQPGGRFCRRIRRCGGDARRQLQLQHG